VWQETILWAGFIRSAAAQARVDFISWTGSWTRTARSRWPRGLELDGSAFGLRTRSQRYGAILDGGVVRQLMVEPDPLRVTVNSATPCSTRSGGNPQADQSFRGVGSLGIRKTSP